MVSWWRKVAGVKRRRSEVVELIEDVTMTVVLLTSFVLSLRVVPFLAGSYRAWCGVVIVLSVVAFHWNYDKESLVVKYQSWLLVLMDVHLSAATFALSLFNGMEWIRETATTGCWYLITDITSSLLGMSDTRPKHSRRDKKLKSHRERWMVFCKKQTQVKGRDFGLCKLDGGVSDRDRDWLRAIVKFNEEGRHRNRGIVPLIGSHLPSDEQQPKLLNNDLSDGYSQKRFCPGTSTNANQYPYRQPHYLALSNVPSPNFERQPKQASNSSSLSWRQLEYTKTFIDFCHCE